MTGPGLTLADVVKHLHDVHGVKPSRAHRIAKRCIDLPNPLASAGDEARGRAARLAKAADREFGVPIDYADRTGDEGTWRALKAAVTTIPKGTT